MLGKLSEKQIEDLLTRRVTGRIGCHADGATYVVPINYVYRSPNIFAHSTSGKKIEMMRKNPEVCFQVDEIQDIFNWQSVIAWGKFEEIKDENEKHRAMQGIIHQLMPLVNKPSGHASHGIADREKDIGMSVELIVYKIVLREKTGRFESEY